MILDRVSSDEEEAKDQDDCEKEKRERDPFADGEFPILVI
jgi:hypothetical protein